MCSINDKNYAIYLNSTEILFFSNNVSDKDIFEASATILNNMNYKTDVKVYSPIDDVIASTENFDAISREVCDKETAEFIGKSESIPFLKFIRNIESYRVN